MHFDDRLATVLRQPVSGPSMARIQFRQLIDLLGRAGSGDEQGATYRQACMRLDELAQAIPATERASILREPLTRLANPDLVGRLATAEPEVASAALAAAELTEEEWLTLVPSLPVRARGILRHRADYTPAVADLLERLGIGDRGLPPAATAPERPARPELVVVEGGAGKPPQPAQKEQEPAGIGAIVQRIEAFRKSRATPTDGAAASVSAAQPQPVDSRLRVAVSAVDFTTDTQGRVNWAEGPLAPALIGYHLAEARQESTEGELRNAIRERQPLSRLQLSLSGAPAMSGTWQMDAIPRFAQPDGRFIGYAGRLRRAMTGSRGRDDAAAQADSMRQILHELRTPANAIQVAAEIIQQQLYGPAPHEYRALAAAIAGDTAQILAGFDELDRLVKLETGALVLARGVCDLGTIVTETIGRLRAWTAPRGSGFTLSEPISDLVVALDQEEAARLVWRLLASLAGTTAPGEMLMLRFDTASDQVSLTVDVPGSLLDRMEAPPASGQSFEPVRALSAGMFGLGFTLRLAVAEAAAAGGALARADSQFRLSLPRLTPAAADHTHA